MGIKYVQNIQCDSNKVLQQVFSFIIGDNFFLLFTNKTTFIELFNRNNSLPQKCSLYRGDGGRNLDQSK